MKGLILAEWTKLRSVNRWLITIIGAAALTVGLGMLVASSGRSDMNEKPDFVTAPDGSPVSDTLYFAHEPVTGDTTVTVRVASLVPVADRPPGAGHTKVVDDSPWAGAAAGLIIKDGTRPGSSYASVHLGTTHGVRMQSDFTTDLAGSASTGSRWLRLVRSGGTITGYESADGAAWRRIGAVTPENLPATAEIGLFVTSAPETYTSRGLGESSVGLHSTSAVATFDSLQGATALRGQQIETVTGQDVKAGGGGGMTEADGVYTITGSGKVGPHAPADDVVELTLIGVIGGLMALIAVGALFATSEYRRGMIRTTFAATPRRGRVLAAKAVVLGATAYVVALVGVTVAFLAALPVARSRGFAPPAFPTPALTDGPVLRALLLSAAYMALVAVFALAVGVLLRHSAAAITTTVILVILPLIVGMILPGELPRWLMYTTLAGGMATQRAKPPTITLAEPWAMIGPWAGITVVAVYTALALGLAWWQLRRRDA